MTVYIAWSSVDLPTDEPGPWREVRPAAPGLGFVDSDDTLSRVFHELKWSLPDDASLVVAPLAAAPKLKYLRPGTQTWLRARLPSA
ncbi:hypothetical protein ENKNEFLB_01770 [Nocardioides aquaticus]|uniref:Uncharacterized protein n=1 Tax=Nocardioides aquaticus TaxID=160826 RepID=A0ABX8EFU6_9ACTN|nr:hypothetical protein [Nocardioides aquaticus]QVT79389.1 hypothetical protein ENKNEFLB_01770 [Nocardioides aquaticus]